MSKEDVLQVYTDIETNTYIRNEKTQKLNLLIDDLKRSNSFPSLPDAIVITASLLKNKVTIRHPFFLHVLYPALSKGAEENNLEAIRQLTRLFKYYGNFQHITTNTEHSIWAMTAWILLEKGLQLAPLDAELLEEYESRQESYLEYTLHELPISVLYGSDGATIEQCDDLLQQLSDYEDVCKKLSLDKTELIADCKLYYNAYKAYLRVYKNYCGFSDYLNQHYPENE